MRPLFPDLRQEPLVPCARAWLCKTRFPPPVSADKLVTRASVEGGVICRLLAQLSNQHAEFDMSIPVRPVWAQCSTSTHLALGRSFWADRRKVQPCDTVSASPSRPLDQISVDEDRTDEKKETHLDRVLDTTSVLCMLPVAMAPSLCTDRVLSLADPAPLLQQIFPIVVGFWKHNVLIGGSKPGVDVRAEP